VLNVFEEFDDSELSIYALRFLGVDYSVSKCCKYFYPQLILLFINIIDLYDQSLKGRTVEEFMKNSRDPTQKSEEQNEKEKLMAAVGQQMLNSFGKVEFWENRYQNADENTYDWYFTWSHFKDFIFENIPIFQQVKEDTDFGEKLQVLDIGCGNSGLCEDLWDEGFKNVIGIDFSEKIVDMMNKRKDLYVRDSIQYQHMDARAINYDSERFDIIFDKGCLDSMICTKETGEYINFTLTEVSRVLKHEGYFILISCGINEIRSNYINMKNFGLELVVSKEVRGREGLEVNINILIFKKK